MCLLIVVPHGRLTPLDTGILARAQFVNPDGVGIATSRHSRRWLDIDVPDIARITRTIDEPYIVHFRYATHGSVTIDNVHPFATVDGYLAHNGVIPGYGNRYVSDTREYVNWRIGAMPVDEIEERADEIKSEIGWSKLAIVGRGRIVTIGDYIWHNGIGYSNSGAFARKGEAK